MRAASCNFSDFLRETMRYKNHGPAYPQAANTKLQNKIGFPAVVRAASFFKGCFEAPLRGRNTSEKIPANNRVRN